VTLGPLGTMLHITPISRPDRFLNEELPFVNVTRGMHSDANVVLSVPAGTQKLTGRRFLLRLFFCSMLDHRKHELQLDFARTAAA